MKTKFSNPYNYHFQKITETDDLCCGECEEWFNKGFILFLHNNHVCFDCAYDMILEIKESIIDRKKYFDIT